MKTIRTGKEQHFIKQQLDSLIKQEQKFLNQKPNQLIKEKLTAIQQNLEEKVPEKVLSTIQKAFEKAFYVVFQKGTKWIEKTYSIDKLRRQSFENQSELHENFTRANMRKLSWDVEKSKLLHQGVTALEGSALGILGIGIPDIPVYLSMVLRNIYEICIKYGFEYQSEPEKIFILNLICTAVAKEQERISYSAQADRVGYWIDTQALASEPLPSLKEMISITASKLSDYLVLAKAVQGMPIIGITGGIVNLNLMNRVGKTASFKYKKRMLNLQL